LHHGEKQKKSEQSGKKQSYSLAIKAIKAMKNRSELTSDIQDIQD